MTTTPIRKMPLFFAAIIFSLLILIQSRFPSKLDPQNASLQIGRSEAPIFLGGVIDSDVETRQTRYGDFLASFDLKAKEISEEETGKPSRVMGKVKVYLRNPNKRLEYGDEILIKGDLRAPQGIRNPGGFDKRAYLERRGIYSLFYGNSNAAPQIINHHQGNWFLAYVISAKRFLSQGLSGTFDKRDAGFLKALFLGERSGLSEDFKDLFIKTGTMHILAVSGFNIGFLSFTLFFLLKPLRVSRNIKLWLALSVIWAYCSLVGWQSPVVRASVMATVLIAAQLLGRKPNGLNSLGLAALIILAASPKQLFDVGFQLSFIAVFAMIRLLPIFLKRPELWPNEKWTAGEKVVFYAKELFWVSFVCLIVTLPITVQNFYIVTPLSLLANMVVVPLSFLIFFVGTLFFLTFWWAPSWFSLIPLVIKLMMKGFIASLFLIENLPGAYLVVGKLDLFFLIFLIIGMIYFMLDQKIARPLVRATVLILFISSLFLAQGLARYFHKEFRMTVLDVGESDAIYLEFPKGGNLLMDAGKGGDGDRGRWVVAPFLKSKGVNAIDALVASHPQEDHIGGMLTLLDEFKIRNVIDGGSAYATESFTDFKKKVQDKAVPYFHVYRGTRIEGYPEIEVRVLNPPEREFQDKNVNNESVVLKIRYQGTSILLTGDVEKNAMTDMLDSGQDLKADVLKVPHHGSRLGAAGERFIRAVEPKISIISLGENNPFHHPSPQTLRGLSSISGNRIFRTDQDHAVEIVSDGNAVRALS